MNPRLLVLAGVGAGAAYPLPAKEFVIGRDEQADLSIADPWLSRRQCLVAFDDGKYFLDDCRSANGTLLNGEKVKNRQPLRADSRPGVGRYRGWDGRFRHDPTGTALE